jgi:hypothetical protein
MYERQIDTSKLCTIITNQSYVKTEVKESIIVWNSGNLSYILPFTNNFKWTFISNICAFQKHLAYTSKEDMTVSKNAA